MDLKDIHYQNVQVLENLRHSSLKGKWVLVHYYIKAIYKKCLKHGFTFTWYNMYWFPLLLIL